MEPIDKFFLVAFSILLISLNLLSYLIRRYIRNKSPGSQSILEVVKSDGYLLVHITGSVFSLTAIISRFQTVVNFSTENQLFVTTACSLYLMSFVSLSVYGGCLSLIRICCIAKLHLIEETIGEIRVRTILASVSFTLALVSCISMILTNEINSGTAYTFLTKKATEPGIMTSQPQNVHAKYILFFIGYC
jgi:hypothetical protein